MDGLECVEICLSELIIDNEKYRFDSEFFQKKYLSAYKRIKTIPHSTIRDELSILTDFHANGSYESIASVFKLLDTPDYAYMVRTTDLEKRDYIHDVKYVSERTYHFLEKSKVYGGEVIINKIGSPGRTFLMPDLHKPVSLGMNQFMLRMKKDGKINNALIYIFLNSGLGKLLIERKINGTVPLTIDKEAIKSIYIPCFSKSFLDCIELISKQFESLFFEADDIYSKAKRKLMDYLKFNKNNISVSGITEKGLLESFGASGRLDAEYYQPKYDDLFLVLSKLSTKPLCSLVTITKSIEPGSECYGEIGVPFIRVSDVSITGISNPTIKIPENTVSSIETLFPKKDTILFSKDGSVGIAYQVEEDLRAVTSGALLHFKVKNTKEILPEYLTLVLNSDIVQLQAERDASGAIIQHWKPDDIKKVTIPILSYEIQKEIADSVKSSFTKRRKAEKLIQVAINTVELAIENGEDAALKWLETQVD